MTYQKSFKEEAVRLSDEIGVKKAAEQLGIPYYTLSDWRYKRKSHGSQAYPYENQLSDSGFFNRTENIKHGEGGDVRNDDR